MAELPSATVSISDVSGASTGGTGMAAVFGCAELNADGVPRVFSSVKALLETHGYTAAASYVALHFTDTKQPILFVPLPVATAGVAGSFDTTDVSGTSSLTIAAGANGYLEETDGILTVTTGGTVGTAGIIFTLSLDGGRTEKTIRLGTATSYTVPYVGIVISFGAGTLVAEDEFLFRTTAPMWDGTAISDARAALGAQTKQVRSFMVTEEVPNSTFAGYLVDAANAYETTNKRFVYARVNVKDRGPLARMSRVQKRMSGTPQLTFAEVGVSGDTITRNTGSWLDEGWAIGDRFVVDGTVSNDDTYVIANVTATVITLGSEDLEAEVIEDEGVTIVGSATLTFAEVGVSGDTITRSSGSWLNDGFAVGDVVTFDGTSLNEVTGTIATLSATVMTLTTTDLQAEVIASHLVTCTQVLTMSTWVAAMDTAFASVDDEKRIDIAIGRARRTCPITGWMFRRPFQWAVSIREYERRMDLHVTTWWKALGSLSGWDLTDGENNIVEYDEETFGGALAAQFTCARTWSNGPNGTFVAQSLTRAPEGTALSMTHNMAVTNLACTVIQAESEQAVGQSLVLDPETGFATPASRSLIEGRVNKGLQKNLYKNSGNGPRASMAKWTAAADDDLSGANATMNGAGELNLNGTLVHIDTDLRVQ